MLNFTTVKSFYNFGAWDKGMVWDAVSKEKISAEEYTAITGDEYPTERPSDES